MSEEKIITGLKTIDVKWIANRNNFVWNVGSVEGIHIHAIQFNDGIFLGEVNYPACLVTGRWLDGVGLDMIVLEVEDGLQPMRITTVKANEGDPERFYGMATLLDLSKTPDKRPDAAASLSVEMPDKFKGLSVREVYDIISRNASLIIEKDDVNAMLYGSFLGTPPEEHIEMIKRYHSSLNGAPLNSTFLFLDTVVVDDEEDEEE